MPPIRKGDGTPVTPKGISQIRTGDGRILFDGPAIPDSAVYHYPLLERDTDTISEELQTEDATAVGTTNISNDWWKGWAEDADGTDDYIDTNSIWQANGFDFSTSLISSWGVAFTIETTDDEFNTFATADFTNDSQFAFETGIGQRGANSGEFIMYLRDRANSDNVQEIASDGTHNDGNKYRIMFGGDGPNASDKTIFVNGNESSRIERDDGSHSGAEQFTYDMYMLSRNLSGDADGFGDATIDNVVVLDEKPDVETASDDYNSQPWS